MSNQLLSVISLLSSDRPDTSSPANVDAAVEVRTNLEGMKSPYPRAIALADIVHLQATRRRSDVWFGAALRKHSISAAA